MNVPESGKRGRFFFLLLPLLFLVAGCGKKPAPEPVPSPMTESYLLKHMRVRENPKTGVRSVFTVPIEVTWRFHDADAFLNGALDAEVPTDVPGGKTKAARPRYLLLFSARAGAWPGFTRAVDTFGHRFRVVPYTSYIREGVFYENFFIVLNEAWMKRAMREDVELLLLGPQTETALTLPKVYPRALVHFLQKIRKEETGSSGKKRERPGDAPFRTRSGAPPNVE